MFFYIIHTKFRERRISHVAADISGASRTLLRNHYCQRCGRTSDRSSIIPRYAGITHTADHILLYEDMCFLGIFLGNLFCLFRFPLPLGTPFLLLFGVFSGIFLGGWILALAEVADMFPVFTRRIRLTQGLPLIILFIALGKLTGTLFFYYFGWQ